MTKQAHLWAVGFDGPDRAGQVRDELVKLAWEKHCLVLVDIGVAVRCPDGTLTLNGEPLSAAVKIHGGTIAHLIAHLALGAPPLTGRAATITLASIGCCTSEAGISDEFVRKVARLIKPGASALFVLDKEGDMDAIFHAIRGLGGTVLETNVDLERAKLIQAALADSADASSAGGP